MEVHPVTIKELVKNYADICAVDHLSLDVYEGEIFGLLGPNGAGKTTTIRIMMDIFRADAGVVEIFGKQPGQVRELVGYLPEERGLYPKRKVMDTLVYMAQLKGVDLNTAQASAQDWLERTELREWAAHRVQDLSRGMQQRLQFAVACVHKPRLLVLDEPFQGLDPVNVEAIRVLMRSLRDEGTTIVLSAHEMNRVEELCDRIAIVNHGKLVLYGNLRDIQTRYGSNTVRLRTPVEIVEIPGSALKERRNHDWVFDIGPHNPQEVLHILVEHGIPLELFEVGTAPLEQIFIDVVTKGQAHA
ncbi:MAG: ATP-binding cassette domain-containing protein [Chloroflexi bacterium]|nr:ATP-binding cassette domain-containing protein [Chloroflexota bacterium]